MAEVWHAQALAHAGQPAEALRRVERALAVGDHMAQPFAPLHGRFTRVMALGQLGRVDAAHAAALDLVSVAERFGATGARFIGPGAERPGVDVPAARPARARRRAESPCPRAHRWCERSGLAVVGRGLLGRPTRPRRRRPDDRRSGRCRRAQVEALAEMETWDGTMAWHQRHRLGLLRARLALETGHPGRSRDLARAVIDDADHRGSLRYVAIAKAVDLAAGGALAGAAAVDRRPRSSSRRPKPGASWVTSPGTDAPRLCAASPVTRPSRS